MTLDEIASRIIEAASGKARFMVGIAGPPGAGKSTLSEALEKELKHRGESVAVLPMDGFHLDNAVLEERGRLAVKGAPDTFDVRGLDDILTAVGRGDEEVLVPIFDRSRELSIGSARPIAADVHIVLTEGIYLLFDLEPWTRLKGKFDLTIFVSPPIEVLAERIRARWVFYGLPEAEIEWKLNGNDLPNGRRIVEHSRPADITIETF